jgi:hypothetical protein
LELLRKYIKNAKVQHENADLRRWWHDWKNDQFDELAGSLIAGHLIECSSYVCGGYYSMFKDLIKTGKHVNMGFPIAEVNHDGTFNIAKEKNSGGAQRSPHNHFKLTLRRLCDCRFMCITAPLRDPRSALLQLRRYR